MLRSCLHLGLVMITALILPVTAHAQTLKPDEVLSTIVLRPVAEPQPVVGADGRVHYAYELLATNASSLVVTIDRVQALGPTGAVLESLDGAALAAVTRDFAGGDKVLGPGGSSVIFMDVHLRPGEALPATLATRIKATRQVREKDGKLAPMPPDSPLPTHFSFKTAPFAVGQTPAVVIAPPLRGKDWVAASGCCAEVTSHRGAVMPVNGKLLAAERFAIDWVQLTPERKIVNGDIHELKSYPYFGVRVYAVANGTVVNVYDAAPEQVPGRPPVGIRPENIGGNLIVEDIGDGHFAFYAHLQPGSLKVKLGEKVHQGEVIGLLGNTGNSSGPHLHFHVMDGPSPLNASGLPYVFTDFEGVGFIGPDDADALEAGRAATVTPRLAGPHHRQMPLNDEVVNFP